MSQYAVFDSHCDTATRLWRTQQVLADTDGHVSLSQIEQFPECSMFFAFCTLCELNGTYTTQQIMERSFNYFLKQLDQCQDSMMLCGGSGEQMQAHKEGKCAVFLSMEGAEGIGCDPGHLDALRHAGFSMVNLTWNEDNDLAGCSAKDGPGLSRKGREFVKRAQSLGMIVDVSHISDKAFWDIMDITQAPVVASHSNSRALCRHSRNLTDDQFLHLCQTGGYAGINLYSTFLARAHTATLEDVYAHMDHFLSISGGNHVALGGDLDGCDMLADGITGLIDYEKMALYLESRNIPKTTLQNIFSNTVKEVVKLCTM